MNNYNQQIPSDISSKFNGSKKPKKNKAWIWVVVAWLLIFIAGSGTVWFLLQRDADNEKNNSDTVSSSQEESEESDSSLSSDEESSTDLSSDEESESISESSDIYSSAEDSSEEEAVGSSEEEVSEESSTAPVVINKISIETQPEKTVYFVGENLNTEGLSIEVEYSDGSTKTMTGGFVCSQPSFNSAGTKTITVKYEGEEASFDVEVIEIEVSSISVSSVPEKTQYYVGDDFSHTGLEIRVNYNNETSEVITSGFECEVPDFYSAGIKTVTVSYGGKTTSFTVTVESITVTSVSVKTKPNDLNYFVGESLNTAGLKLKVNYSDGTYEDITSGFTCSPTSFSSSGTKTITVSYGGKTTSFTVTVENLTVSSISVNTLPTRVQYNVGDSLDTSGLKIKVNYANGTTENITSGFTCSPTSFSTVGSKSITVSYGGKTTSFTVTVVSAPVSSVTVDTLPDDTEYLVGERLNTTGLSLLVTHSDGSTERVTSGFTCSPTTFSSVGRETIIVTYEGKRASFVVDVTAPSVISVSVYQTPDDTEYFVGETLNPTGLIIEVNYNDGTSENITSGFTCSPTYFSTAGNKSITVSYEGKTTSFIVTVIEN